MQVLIISNNIKQAEFLQKGFKYENLSCDVMSMLNLDLLNNYVSFYDGIMLLDDGSIDHVHILEKINSSFASLPIFLLVNSYDERIFEIKDSDLIDMLYVRPFSFRTIAAEMRFSIYKKNEEKIASKMVLRDLELDLFRHVVRQNDNEIILRNKEFALLHYLMLNQGKVLTRSTILEHVWDRNASIVTNTVDVHISMLRKKLEKNAEQKYIYTIPCTGYLFS